jgi:FeoB-associated Cys-rich membrane protein
MDWQLAIVGVLVALAAAYLGRQTWRTWAGRKAGCGGCKCGGAAQARAGEGTAGAALIPPGDVRLRRR